MCPATCRELVSCITESLTEVVWEGRTLGVWGRVWSLYRAACFIERRATLRNSSVSILVAVSALLSACTGSNSTHTRYDSQTDVTPSASVTPSPAESEKAILFSDDFSDRSKGWPVGTPAGLDPQALSYGYRQAQYVIEVGPSVKLAYNQPAPARRSALSVQIDVDIREEGAAGVWGVYCNGDVASRSFYVFTIGLRGHWGIGRVGPAGGRFLAKGPPSSSVGPGSAEKHLTASCRSDPSTHTVRLSLEVDGNELLHAVDRNGLVGGLQSIPGLYVESTDRGSMRVLFDNFELQALPQS